MDPQSVNHTSRNSQLFVFVPKSLFLRQKLPMHHFWQKHINRLTSDSFLGPFSPRNMFHFWTFCSRKICHFWTQNTLPICSKKKNISFVTKLDLNQPKRFFSKRFRKDSSDNGLISNKMTNICFFMFGWKTNQWNPASEWNDFVSQASKKVLLWLQTLYLSRPGL